MGMKNEDQGNEEYSSLLSANHFILNSRLALDCSMRVGKVVAFNEKVTKLGTVCSLCHGWSTAVLLLA